MEVALTRRARPVIDHPHIDPSGTGSGTATKLKFRTFQAVMCMKTNDIARCQVPSSRSQGIHLDSEVRVGGLGTARDEKTTFQAGMCMKALNNEGASGDVDENKGPQGRTENPGGKRWGNGVSGDGEWFRAAAGRSD